MMANHWEHVANRQAMLGRIIAGLVSHPAVVPALTGDAESAEQYAERVVALAFRLERAFQTRWMME